MLRILFTNLQKWCFIAGTPVMTMAGPLPIEQIEPGMMVWSAPECGTGQAGYRPVLETYRNRAPAVWHVSYDHDADPATPDETLGASAEHPVWVEETASFLPAADLRPGMTLRMAGGQGGTIAKLRETEIIRNRLQGFGACAFLPTMARARWIVPWADSETKPAIYHCLARVVDRRFAFGPDDKEQFRIYLRMMENFSGCRVLAYCVMSKH